jgi:hypothetical protein
MTTIPRLAIDSVVNTPHLALGTSNTETIPRHASPNKEVPPATVLDLNGVMFVIDRPLRVGEELNLFELEAGENSMTVAGIEDVTMAGVTVEVKYGEGAMAKMNVPLRDAILPASWLCRHPWFG